LIVELIDKYLKILWLGNKIGSVEKIGIIDSKTFCGKQIEFIVPNLKF
jgi:hypothetical protein